MKKKCKVVMLPTNNKSKIWLGKDTILKSYNQDQHAGSPGNAFHLYILSDDEIKKGDWYIHGNNYICQLKSDNPQSNYNSKYNKKIIATTDSSLSPFLGFDTESGIDVSNKIPSIPQSFIDKYVNEYNKGNKIEEVMVEYEPLIDEDTFNIDEDTFNIVDCLLLNPDNSINIKYIKDSWTREEVIGMLNQVNVLPDSMIKFDINEWIENNLY